MEIIKIYDLVKKLLKEKEELRGNDDLLYLTVLRVVHPYWDNGRINTDIENAPIGEFFKMRKSLKLPTFESVTRCRRKVQEENAELKPCEWVQESRKRQEEKFYKFATKQAEFSF